MIETMEKPAGTLSDATRDKLMGVSVATLCTALFKRGLRNQTIQDMRAGGAERPQHGRPGLHAALHPGAGGPERARGSSATPTTRSAPAVGPSARRARCS